MNNSSPISNKPISKGYIPAENKPYQPNKLDSRIQTTRSQAQSTKIDSQPKSILKNVTKNIDRFDEEFIGNLEHLERELDSIKIELKNDSKEFKNTINKIYKNIFEHETLNRKANREVVKFEPRQKEILYILKTGSKPLRKMLFALQSANTQFSFWRIFPTFGERTNKDKLVYKKLIQFIDLAKNIFDNENGVKELIDQIKKNTPLEDTIKNKTIQNRETTWKSAKKPNRKVHFNEEVETLTVKEGASKRKEKIHLEKSKLQDDKYSKKKYST